MSKKVKRFWVGLDKIKEGISRQREPKYTPSFQCPIACLLREKVGAEKIGIGKEFSQFYIEDSHHRIYHDETLQGWIKRFDNYLDVTPIELELQLEIKENDYKEKVGEMNVIKSL